ncbi:MAG: amino acid racemase, partial [bacterium]|nr:amino acid racemase [bacterium]
MTAHTIEQTEQPIKKTIGILGGMGPEATVYLLNLIVKLTDAATDQEHIGTIVYNNPKTPDRTASLLEGGPSPLPALIEGACLLEKAGADFILMPCVTAHYFHDQIANHVSIPFIHLLEVVLAVLKGHPAGLKKVGLIATSGTVKTGLFQRLFQKNGLETVLPGENDQKQVMKAIYNEKGIKSGCVEEPKTLLEPITQGLISRGAEGIIAGCTEIPLVLSQKDMAVPF